MLIYMLPRVMTQCNNRSWQLCSYLDLSNLLFQLLNFSVDFIDIIEEAEVGVLCLHEPLHNGINVLHACRVLLSSSLPLLVISIINMFVMFAAAAAAAVVVAAR